MAGLFNFGDGKRPAAVRPSGTRAPGLQAMDPFRSPDRPDAAFEDVWRSTIKRRVVLVLSLIGFWSLVVEARLLQLQVFQHDAYTTQALRQQQRLIKPSARRGAIVDRNGEILAASVEARSVIADPEKVVDPVDTARRVCQALGECTEAERAEIVLNLTRDGSFAWVVRQLPPAQAERVLELKLPGIALLDTPEARRYYPKAELAGHLLGFVGVDNQGLSGIEGAYDTVIRGEEGIVLVQKDARRDPRQNRILTRVAKAPTEGATIELTIDQFLQHIVERELKAGVDASRSRSGTAIVMDPETGEILAMANYPSFNPNFFGQYSAEDRRNSATQEIYEPGSTFKIVTASAAIDEGVLSPNDLIDCNPGWIKIGSRKPVTEAHGNFGVLTFEDVIVRSSNVGAIKAGLQIGAERFDRYLQRYGFGQKLAPDFRGESRGMVTPPAKVNDSALASMAMGYEIGVTPLQMASAVSAVANGGQLMEPHLVRAVITDGRRAAVAPKVLHKVVTPETAATVTSIMEEVVKRGTGVNAQVEGYQVAGKTGTANEVENGHYSQVDFHGSFVGFVPSRKPAFTILVVMDAPRVGHYGAEVAAPVFKRIAEAALRQYGVPRTINPLPAVILANDAPEPARQPRTAAVLPALAALGGLPLMPDVRGLAARDAVRALVGVGLSVQFSGTGAVVGQTPAPGEPIERGGVGVLQLQRPPADHRSSGGGGR